MIKALGYAAKHSFSRLRPFEFERQEAGPNEIEIEVQYCGVCHSDIHQVKNEWSNTVYPCVPGHEVVGRVTKAGSGVTRHAVGDLVGVGCMIESCRHCEPCHSGDQNYCEGPNSWLATYNGPMVPAKMAPDGRNMYERDNTFGGYSDTLVVNEDFALKIPAKLKPEGAAPILCAGVTTYSPLKHWGVKAGDKVGVIGFGRQACPRDGRGGDRLHPDEGEAGGGGTPGRHGRPRQRCRRDEVAEVVIRLHAVHDPREA